MQEKIEQLEKEIAEIKKRNLSVEADKAWETGTPRKIFVAVLTYLVIGLYMWSIHIDRFWLNAIVPTLGFLFSTLTLSYFKDIWVKNKTRFK